jgi:hypothetical protein
MYTITIWKKMAKSTKNDLVQHQVNKDACQPTFASTKGIQFRPIKGQDASIVFLHLEIKAPTPKVHFRNL